MSDQDTPAEQPKIIVDDDWKAQVEKEKAAAAAATDQTADQSAGASSEPSTVDSTESADVSPDASANASTDASADAGQLPPASLEVHISMLFSQCMAALGQMPGPDGQPTELNKPFAKHFIDTIEMLQQKTEGNVTDEEKKMMAEILHAMRMAYVSVK